MTRIQFNQTFQILDRDNRAAALPESLSDSPQKTRVLNVRDLRHSWLNP